MGALIAVEGISGAGKTTHAKLLRDWLQKKRVPTLLLNEPSDSHFGLQLKKVIVENNSLVKCKLIEPEQAISLETILFAADRLIQYNTKIFPALKEDKTVVLDRSVYSSYAYQQARGISSKFVRAINRFVSEPDLVIVLDAGLTHTQKRLKAKLSRNPEFDAIFDNENVLKKARKNYLKLANKNPKKFRLIKSLQPIDKTQRNIQKYVDSFLKRGELVYK